MKTAVIVISHNDRALTDGLCENIMRNTKCPHDLYVIETGSRKENFSSYATLWVKDGIRMTRGFNWGIRYAKWKAEIEGFKYDSFWCLVNDSRLPEADTLFPMVSFLRANNDCGQIHPYITNSPSVHLKKKGEAPRKESFSEFVCPLFSSAAIDLNIFDDRFFYGWGLDYEIPYLLHKAGLRTYIDDRVCVTHTPGTTVSKNNDDHIKSMERQFTLSRDNMVLVLKQKYGDAWGKIFLDGIPPDVSRDAYVDWVVNVGRNFSF